MWGQKAISNHIMNMTDKISSLRPSQGDSWGSKRGSLGSIGKQQKCILESVCYETALNLISDKTASNIQINRNSIWSQLGTFE